MDRRIYIVDSSVIIDYQLTKIEVLWMISEHMGRVLISSPILAEVNGLCAEDCPGLGLEVLEPSLEDYFEVTRNRPPGLSDEDTMCLVLSKRLDGICLTNDKALHKACQAEGVPSMWGLRPMLQLVEFCVLSPREALKIAHEIKSMNINITDDVIDRFRLQLSAISPTKRTPVAGQTM